LTIIEIVKILLGVKFLQVLRTMNSRERSVSMWKGYETDNKGKEIIFFAEV
jgi:hypothetical protein